MVHHKKAKNNQQAWSAPHFTDADEVLERLGTGRIVSLFGVICVFRNVFAHKNTILLTAF